MSITRKDIKALTPEHRIVWKDPGAPREVELGLYVDGQDDLCADVGYVVRWKDGTVTESSLNRIIRIIEPAFTPRRGLVIGHPGNILRRLVCVGDDEWLGFAPEISEGGHWFTEARWFDDDAARSLIENHGWVVVDDLTKGNDGP